MVETERILRQHALRYPAMEPADAVKLLYQNEFGGGHLIRDTQACLDYLQREYDSVEKAASAPVCEPIGNGIIRVYLAALLPEEIEHLGKAFLKSAAERKGTMDSFFAKLDVLRRLTAEGVFGFGVEALRAYLAEYEAAGYPPVSHSPQYRQEYAPAYRIILEKYWS